MSFLKDNWIWIVTPMALILGMVIWFVLISDGPTDPSAPHTYPLFGE